LPLREEYQEEAKRKCPKGRVSSERSPGGGRGGGDVGGEESPIAILCRVAVALFRIFLNEVSKTMGAILCGDVYDF
jgi:hypothetical protein